MTTAPQPTRERRAPIVGLVLVAVLSASAAVVAQLFASDWQFKMNTFYSDSANVQLTTEQYQELDRLGFSAYQLTEMSVPLLIGTMAAVLAILGVLAYRWERKAVVEANERGQATEAS